MTKRLPPPARARCTRSRRDVRGRHADEGRWLAREFFRGVSWVIAAITLLVAVTIAAEGIGDTYVSIGHVIAGGAIAAIGLPGALHLELASLRVTFITIDGGWLTLTDAAQTRRHRLHRGSLHAVPWTFGARSGMGTVLFVRLDDGAVVSIAIRGLLPDDRYAADEASRAHLYLDRAGAALLERVRPHVMPREPKSLPADPTYSIPLRPRSSPSAAAPACLYIAGDTVALGVTGNPELVARAKASQIHVLCYRMGFWEQESDEWRGYCISLLFRQEQRMLTIGIDRGWGLSPEVSDLWRGPTPTGPAPQYLIGQGELMKLMDVLRVPTKR